MKYEIENIVDIPKLEKLNSSLCSELQCPLDIMQREKKILENIPNAAIQSFDCEGNILYWNTTSERIFELKKEEVLGKNFADLQKYTVSDHNLKQIIETVRYLKKPLGPEEMVVKTKSGKLITCYNTIFPIEFSDGKKEFISMDVDITQQKQLEQKLINIDKLNLMGQMAANIAHEIRNPMTTIRGLLQVFSVKEEFKSHKSYLELMVSEIDKADAIISEFLYMAKDKVMELEYHNLNSIISKLAPLLRANLVAHNLSLRLELGEISEVLLDEKEIKQLILNLAENAMEAMAEGSYITIKTYEENSQVVLVVEDIGKGIPKEIIEKIGTPFFTTKENRAGLGLSVCQSIVERHRAKLSFDSNSEGTSVYISFKVN